MSFASTPLGQGRRLDQKTFFAKSAQPRPNQQQQTKPTSRGSDTVDPPLRPGSWSVTDTTVQIANAFTSAVTHPNPLTSATIPTGHAAASLPNMSVGSSNPNNAWASASTSQRQLPRGTSQEYEAQAQVAAHRRLGAKPPSRNGTAPSGLAASGPRRHVVHRHDSSHLSVPDSEPEREEATSRNTRGKSPFAGAMNAVNSVAQGLGQAATEVAFILRARSKEPEGPEESYNYSREEREVQAQASTSGSTTARKNVTAANRKNRMSSDNMAYKPSNSDLDISDEDDSDGEGKKRRRKKKRGEVGGPLNSLPVLSADKRRKKRRGKKADGDDDEASEDDSREEIGTTESMTNLRTSAPPSKVAPPLSRSSTTRGAVPHGYDPSADYTMNMNSAEEGLASINEEPDVEDDHLSPPAQTRRDRTPIPPPPEVDGLHRKRRHVSEPPIGGSSPGVLFGQLVNTLGRAGATIFSFTLHTVAVLLFWIGRVLGFALDSLFGVPKRFVGQHSGLVQRLLRGLILASAVCGVYYLLRGPVSRIGFGGPSSNHSVYTPPTAPAADVSELSDRLLKLESALSGLSFDNSQERKRADTETQGRVELQAKVDQLERDLRNERKRTSSAEEKAQSVGGELVSVQREIAALRSTIKALPPPVAPGSVSGKDEDARQKLEALERKLGAVEEEAKEALELGKDAASKAKEREKEKEAAATKPSWWSKAGSSNRADQLTVRASDGTDVTALIGKIVDSAVGRFHKDDVSRPDFASDSGGAHVIPSLTSDTYALRPVGVKGRMLGLVTGHGYALGRPPVTALHHELHIGNCWPFAGTQGQLGIKLVMPVIIDAVTIDHVAKEVAFDMRTAPREMELWGLVEGRGNVEKVHAFYREKARLRAEQQESDGEVSSSSASEASDEGFDFDAHLDSGSNDRYPSTLPRHAMYFRIASFTYDVHSSKNVQTFAVPEDVRALGVDFGVVALRVRSNWGMEEFTCLYRVRVHGERLVQPELPSPPPPSEEEAEK